MVILGPPLHLLSRFVESLRPGGPSDADRLWALDHLLPGEGDLWLRLSDADRCHTVTVARAVMDRLVEVDRAVVAAALLHDVGKLASGLGTLGRVVATLVAATVRSTTTASWSEASGFRRQVFDYLHHPEEGATLLSDVGSDPFTVAWTAEHHLSPHLWTVDRSLGEALAEADDD